MNGQPVASTSGGMHRTYTTKFPLTEFPISEGGNWIGGATVGKDWGDMGTASNHAYSVMPSPGANYDDPTALLTGSWGPNQTVTATVWVGTAQGEVELRLRSAMSPHVNTGYEVTWNTVPGNGYLSLTRWNGALGDWTGLGILYGDQYVVSNGDVVSATITGNIITAYKNGVQQDQWVDSGPGSFATGAPGMGADWATVGRPSSYGFSSYLASDSTTGTVSTSEFRARMNHWIHSVFSRKDTIFTTRDLVEIAGAALLTALVYLVFRRYPALSAKLAERFHASASRVSIYVLVAMLLPLVLRLALLPWLPPPEPHIHDEFSHLLVADTLAAGRLANPPHPLWRHLETIYVLQQPTYSSIYPIGQGLILAVGKVLVGSPWAGVLLSVVLMCGATSWMLFGCLPPNWAAVGGLLAALDYGLAADWVDSYWGGAFCAFGGALLFGALCRLRRSPSKSMAVMVGIGWSIVWLTHPFESLLPLMVTWGVIAAFIIRDPRLWRRWLGSIGLILSIQIFAGCVTALHNRAVTGSLTTLPYHLSQQAYGVPQSLLWQKAIEEPALRFAELKEMYRFQREVKDRANARPARQLGLVLYTAWKWSITPWYSLPIVLLVFLLKDRQVILGGGIMACALTAAVLYPFFFSHYVAAYSCIIVFLIIRGMMTLFQWSFRGRAVGPLVVLFLMSGGLMMGLRIVPSRAILGLSHDTRQAGLRVRVSKRLMRFGGRQVVFVRYAANHSFQEEWVYNAADVDAASIVWCRASDPIDEAEVTAYYKDRHFWVANVDRDTVRVSSYQPGLQLGLSTGSPGGDSQNWVLTR